jgi:hypothetical protein
MSGTNLLDTGTGGDAALTVEAGADAITDLLKDPATDLSEEDQGQEEATEETEAGEEAQEAGEESEEATEESETEATEEEDGPESYASGRFASDDAKVTLKDGTVISVQDLKRGYLSQASFTRGTQENAKEREILASRKAEVEQTAQALQQQRDFLLQVSQQFMPQAPDEALLDQNSASYDPIRYMAQKADYDKRIGSLTELQKAARAEQERIAQEQQRQMKEHRDKEAQKLFESMPELKKPEVAKKFWAEAVETMAEYGFSQEEVDAAADHRIYKVFRDLSAYRRARSKVAPTVKETLKSKPVMTGKKRMAPQEQSSREKQARQEQLRKTGSFDAGVSALMDLDL